MGLQRLVRAAGLAGFLALGAPVAALSCSPVPGYVRPSNFELVQIADAIVIATPIGERDDKTDEWDAQKVRFHIKAALKGDITGDIDVSRLMLGRTTPSDPRDIASSHPEGYMGSCNRVTMSKAATYVLFLQRRGQAYATLGYPFSRVSEDYAGEGALWTRTVRTYLRLQTSETPMDQLAELERMRAEILAKPAPSRDETALANDIDQHLASLSPWKPTEFLLAAYDDLKAGRPRKTRDPSFDAEQSDISAFTDLVLGGSKSAAAPPPRRDPRQTRLLDMLIEGDHPTALPLFETFARPDAAPDELAMAIRFLAKNGHYREAYQLIEDRAAGLTATLPEDDAHLLLQAIGDAQQDPFYGEGHPRWRDEPDIAARWPKLALALTRTSEERFDEDPRFTETLMSILGADYRANPELTFMLAGYSNAITDWAARELREPENLKASTGDVAGGPADPLMLPLRIVVRWLGSRDDDEIEALKPAFCLGPVQRRTVFELWGRTGSWDSANALLRFAASPLVDDADRQVLMTAIPAWDRRYEKSMQESWLAKDPALRKLANGQPITRKDIKPNVPISCPA